MIFYNGTDASTLARAQRLMSFFDDVPVDYSVAGKEVGFWYGYCSQV